MGVVHKQIHTDELIALRAGGSDTKQFDDGLSKLEYVFQFGSFFGELRV